METILICFLGFLIWMSPPFSFAALTHCTFINPASVSTGAKMPSERRERTCQGPSGGAPSHPCMCLISSVWNSVGNLGGGGGFAVNGSPCLSEEWWKSQERPGALNAALLVGFTYSERDASWMLMENSPEHHYREEKPPQVHHGCRLPQTQYQDTGCDLRSEEPLMT